MEVLSGEQMRDADRHAIETLGIPSLDLMESAGAGIADELLRSHPNLREKAVVVVCGKGNNGGDGLVIARHLDAARIQVRTIVLADPGSLGADAAANFERARAVSLDLECAGDETTWARCLEKIPSDALVIDAIVGTGIRGAVRGLNARVIQDLVRGEFDIVSVDLPSGLDSDSHQVVGPTVTARITYTLCRPKPALVFEPAARHAGEWRAIAIGIPEESIARQRSKMIWQDAASVAGLLPPRRRDAHKGKFGHALVVAGSPGRSGAAVLCARGALRGGAGLVTVACPASIRSEIAVQQAELMTEPLLETADGWLAAGSAARVQDLLGQRDTLAIGPGLGTDAETSKAVRLLTFSARRATVIDADGLNALAFDPESLLSLRDAAAPRILTPHPGEAARLLGITSQEVQADRLSAARTLAERSGAIVVLKGNRTLVAKTDGTVAINAGGNPGMATAGSGDVLTGVLAALLARGLDTFDAARLGVFLHADAGDRAAHRLGEDSMTASDVLAHLPAAFMAQTGAAS